MPPLHPSSPPLSSRRFKLELDEFRDASLNEEVGDDVAAARYKKEAAQSIANKAHKLAAYRDIDERFKFQVTLIGTIVVVIIIIIVVVVIIIIVVVVVIIFFIIIIIIIIITIFITGPVLTPIPPRLSPLYFWCTYCAYYRCSIATPWTL